MDHVHPQYGERPAWKPEVPRLRPFRLILTWLVSAAALLVAAEIVPHVSVNGFLGAVVAAALIALLNAVLPPIVAALRLPFALITGFLVVLVLDAIMLRVASEIAPDAIQVDSFGWALVAALVASAVTVVLDAIFGTNDDDTYTFRVVQRIARRSKDRITTNVPGILFLEIDGLALPVLRRALRDGNAPVMARWIEDGSHRLDEWETDLSSQTGASQSGILLGSNEHIPAFRWVEKETGTDDRLLGSARLRGDRAPSRARDRAAARRRSEPRQPPLRRGRARDPHRQPDRGGEEVRTRAIAPSWRTASTSRGSSCSSPGR